MNLYFESKTGKLYNSDVFNGLNALPDESVHCCVTSPPYWGLRDYGIDSQIGLEKTPEKYISKMVSVFREVRRVLRNDGTLWLNLGDSYVSGKSRYSSKAQTIAGKKRNEPINGNRPNLNHHAYLKDKDLSMIPSRVAIALQSDGWYLRSEIIWHKPNPMPESVTDRPTKSHEMIYLFSKSSKYYYDYEAVKEPVANPERINFQSGSRSNGINNDRNDNDLWERSKGARYSKRNLRDVWTVATTPFKGSHFATFPKKLIEPCILAGCPENGTVLDPFGGAGTTAVVSESLNRKWILIELNPDYCELSKNRIQTEQLTLKDLPN